MYEEENLRNFCVLSNHIQGSMGDVGVVVKETSKQSLSFMIIYNTLLLRLYILHYIYMYYSHIYIYITVVYILQLL